jgi:two-component system response regulator AtoC
MSGILIIDDDPKTLRNTRDLLACKGYEVRTAGSGDDVLRELQRVALPEVILLDMVMRTIDGIETLRRIRELAPSANVIALASQNDSTKVVQAIKWGAVDYLTKPLDEEQLLSGLRRHMSTPSEEGDSQLLLEELDPESFFLAASPAMKKIFEQVGRIARVDVPVLITGESGTGKEIIAKLLHRQSPRANKRFLKVNCAAIPDELLESELFGYEAGAFTGASSRKLGYLEQCNHGTVLLDEIGEMPTRLQAKLLQVLQERKFFRLGGKWPVEVDVRILAATNINVKAATEQGRFRLDLYYRLNPFSISVPPLRERCEEIVPLSRQFMKRLSHAYRLPSKPLTESILQSYLQHAWPGNLRELHNEVKRYLVLGDESLATEPALCTDYSAAVPHPETVNSDGALKQMVRELKGKAEAEAIRKALEQTHWRRKNAAELLGISYKALIYKSRQYGILGPSVRGKKKPPKTARPGEMMEVNVAVKSAANDNGVRLSALEAVEMKDGKDLR